MAILVVAGRLLIALLLFYITLDLSCPLLPGAFNFNPDRSVDGLSSDQGRHDLPPPAVSEPSPVARTGLQAESRRLVFASAPVSHPPRTRVPRSHRGAPDPGGSTEDH